MKSSHIDIRVPTILLTLALFTANCTANSTPTPTHKDASNLQSRSYFALSHLMTPVTKKPRECNPGLHVMLTTTSPHISHKVVTNEQKWYAIRPCVPLFSVLCFQAHVSPPQVTGEPKITSKNSGTSVKLNPDDVPLFPVPPAGIDAYRPDIPHGKLQMIEYYSKTVGTNRYMNVYTPPGYSPGNKYPVLYLLHGIGGDETEWERFAKPNLLMDNLLAEKKTVPMIIVMPNGRAQKDDRAVGNIYAAAPAFAAFEPDLLQDVIPTIEAHYSVLTDKDHRALAGLSMGGGQALDFGLQHLERTKRRIG